MEIIKFEARWCSQCKAQDGILKQLQEKHPNLKVTHIDVEREDTPYIDEYLIQSLPTTIVKYDNGDHKKFIGLTSLNVFEEALKENKEDFEKGPVLNVS